MKFRVVVEIDINFDLECDGEMSNESVVDSDAVGQAIVANMINYVMVDDISDKTGWCINNLSIKVPEAECIDYLD